MERSKKLGIAALGVLLAGLALVLSESEEPQAPAIQEPAETPASPRDGAPPPAPAEAPADAATARRAASSEPSSAGRAPQARPPEATGAERPPGPPGTADPPDDDDDVTPRTIWTIDREGIQGAIRDVLPELKDCYSQWLQHDPTISGRLAIEFTIAVSEEGAAAPDGTELAGITDVAIRDSDVEHPWMHACAMNVFGDLWFNPPEGGSTKVSYPVLFERNPEP